MKKEMGDKKWMRFTGGVQDCKSEFFGGVSMNKDIKIELLGIGVILSGIAISTSNILAIILGVIGFGVTSAGCFLKDK